MVFPDLEVGQNPSGMLLQISIGSMAYGFAKQAYSTAV